MTDRYGTIFFTLAGLVFAATGLTFTLAPGLVVALREAATPSADAINDVRVVYGAIELGLGLYFLVCARRPALREGGYWAALLVGGVAALCRFVGFALVPGTPVAHLAYGVLDLVGAAFALHGLRRRHEALDSAPRVA